MSQTNASTPGAAPDRAEILALLHEALDLPGIVLDTNLSFAENGVDSVAVVDALFFLEERLAINVDFNASGVEASDLDGPIYQFVDRIIGSMAKDQG